MISFSDTLIIHKQLIAKYGGSYGLRDQSLLESALQRPFTTYNKVDLYPTPITKATALLESIILNHPFIDGNKRTGYFLFRAFLLEHSLDINLNNVKKYQLVIDIASGKLKGHQLLAYIETSIHNV